MAGRADYQWRDYTIQAASTSVGATPISAYVVVPFDGEIIESYLSTLTAITTTDSTVTLSVLPAGVVANAVAVGGTLVATVTGAGVGKSYTAKHSSPRLVREGDTIRFTPAGGGGAGVVGNFVVKIRR